MATARKSATDLGQENLEKLVQKAMSASEPEADPPSQTLVQLPGGLVRGDHLITTAEVKELTGVDEEALVRAALTKPNNVTHFMNVLLEQGVVRFSGQEPKDTKRLLKSALIGDRDALIYGIRRATYGNDIDIERWQCPKCGEHSDLNIPLDDIPVRKLENPNEQTIEVELKGNRKAKVRMLNGEDQLVIFENPNLNSAERLTLTLQRCLVSLTEADGTVKTTVGLSGTYARSLSVPDRHKIERAMYEEKPGPQSDDLKITHETCGEEVPVGLGMGHLFPDFVLV